MIQTATTEPKRMRDGAETRRRLLEAARDIIRAKGYGATTVDDLCLAAGVSKGSFFHHFESKDALGVAAIEAFGAMADALFTTAPYTVLDDPRDRVFGYLDLRVALLEGDIAQYTCLMGTTVQEVHATHPELRAAAERVLSAHVAMLEKDLAAAKRKYAPRARWKPESVGYFIQSVLQGAFIFAKAKQSPEVAIECLQHLRRYLESLIGQPRHVKSKET